MKGGEDAMVMREEYLEHLWTEVINSYGRDQGLDNIIANCKRFPTSAFGDMGAAIERLLAAGASRRDLRLIFRAIAYEAVFATLYSMSDPGLPEDSMGLQEDLLTSDPSGMEGAPGSIDTVV
jgi:hypothetical protein